jgi:LDH2 family malate/lactate/ureidoglycolate dehydrogenase
MIIERTRYTLPVLRDFVRSAIERAGASADDAALAADVLVASDLRGIESHGVARLETYYVDRMRAGQIEARPTATTLRETPTSIAVDAGNGLGHPVSVRTMRRTIEKAADSGCCVATVRHSNHYGIAGYYAMMALEHGMIGISSTNAYGLAVPTFGSELLLGTNPFAFAIPAQGDDAFVLDMATTTVALGKLEIARRLGKPLHPGWAVDRDGHETLDPATGIAGALLPLGGFGTANGGHKGFGLGLLSDILCGVLGGGVFGPDMPNVHSGIGSAITSHFFMALRIDAFRPLDEFRADVQRELDHFRSSTPAPGCERVYTAGEPEAARTREHLANGIGLDPVVVASLNRTAEKLGIDPPVPLGI